VATDLAGNREPIPTTSDAITSVNLTNSPPSVASAQIVVNEGETLRYTNVVADPNVPPQTLSFGLLGPVPAGAALNPLTGVLTWPTTEATGPGTNVFTVRVSDNGFPSFSATGTVTVVVNELNRPPSLAAITNRVVREGQLLAITNVASDPDLPANTLTFSLGPGSPAGAAVHPVTGVFTWRPSEFQGGVTNRLTVIVTDNGIPPLSATQQFSVVVRDTLSDFELSIGSVTVLAGESNAVAIALKSGLELSRVDFVLEVPETKLSNLVLRAVSPEIASVLLLPLGPDLAGISVDFDPALAQTGLRTLAELGFTAVPGTNSAIVPLHLMELSGRTVSGLALSNAAPHDGRVFLVGSQPILEAYRLANGQVGLSLHGRPGRSYTVESTRDLSGSPWQPASSWLQTNLVQILEGATATNRTQFWRAQEQ
jgi:Putative Ig domain